MKYTTELPLLRTSIKAADAGPPVVLLTGSTGNIGSHLLAHLLAERRIKQVYTMNRPSDMGPLARVRAAFRERELPIDLLDDRRLVCLEGDVTQDFFGVGKAQHGMVGSPFFLWS